MEYNSQQVVHISYTIARSGYGLLFLDGGKASLVIHILVLQQDGGGNQGGRPTIKALVEKKMQLDVGNEPYLSVIPCPLNFGNRIFLRVYSQ